MLKYQIDNFLVFGVILTLLIRWSVSRWPYSGAGKPPMFGDYEAQRHWMEITVNLQTAEWYQNTTQNDLMYWGLDYPPLTAYHSYLNGKIASAINPEWVALKTSRGMESYDHKLFMRYTVLVSDLLIFYSGVIFYWLTVDDIKSHRTKAVFAVSTLLYPGLILIDHGHFQYNCISLGLTLWAVAFLNVKRELLSSIAFCLSLNYKQMSLYHALPFFFYLLGHVVFYPKKSISGKCLKLFLIASSVILTFGICWYPFLTNTESVALVLKRLFPVSRGLYEDKVATFWCSLEFVIKMKRLLSPESLIKLCALTTLTSIIPSGIHLSLNPTLKNLKYSLVICSCGFFLFSYQVHEKSILLVSLAVSLLMDHHTLCGVWFYVVSTFSLQPLLTKDQLIIPYFTLMILNLIFNFGINGSLGLRRTETPIQKLRLVTFIASLSGCCVLMVLPLIIKPFSIYPDLFSLLNAIFSCLHFFGFYAYFNWLQLFRQKKESSTPQPVIVTMNGSSSLYDKSVSDGKKVR